MRRVEDEEEEGAGRIGPPSPGTHSPVESATSGFSYTCQAAESSDDDTTSEEDEEDGAGAGGLKAAAKPRPVGWRTHVAKTSVCWTAFLAGFVSELFIHTQYGVSGRIFEAEEDCKLRRGQVMVQCAAYVVCEIVCRVCLTVVLVAMVWELFAAVWHGGLLLCLSRTYALGDAAGAGKAHERGALFAIVAFSAFILCLGIWSALSEDTMPFWAVVVCHVCDVFCHGIILSALIGIAFDLAIAVRRGELRAFVCGLALCYDTIESHGVLSVSASPEADWEANDVCSAQEGSCGLQPPAEQGFGSTELLKQHRTRYQGSSHEIARAAVIWFFFLATLVAAVSASYFEESTPAWVGTATKLEGCCCWAGIAWWVAQSVAEARYFFRDLHPRAGRAMTTSEGVI